MADDVLHPSGSEALRHHVGQLLGIAVHRAVEDDDPVFGFVVGEARIEVTCFGEAFACPDDPVGRADVLDVESLLLDVGQRLLDEGSVLTDDTGVVACHLLEVGLSVGDARVEDVTAQRTEGAEGIGREEHSVGLLVGEHHLRPVYHRRHQEGELVLADAEGIATLHLV